MANAIEVTKDFPASRERTVLLDVGAHQKTRFFDHAPVWRGVIA